jgi:hypothetical protein
MYLEIIARVANFLIYNFRIFPLLHGKSPKLSDAIAHFRDSRLCGFAQFDIPPLLTLSPRQFVDW